MSEHVSLSKTLMITTTTNSGVESMKSSKHKERKAMMPNRNKDLNLQQQLEKIGPSAAKSDQQQSSKLIKKAHVRFEDYLDLNEENMRRSCKKLMNHLYSDSSPSNLPADEQSVNAAAAVGAQQTSQLICAAPATPQESQSSPADKSSESCLEFAAGAPINSPLNGNRFSPPPQLQQQQQQQHGGKSYLRSQYERRQLRQMDLVNKMQSEEETTYGRHAPVGANNRRPRQQALQQVKKQQQQQQDLVAKSHELSKRRFFEKLERRESMMMMKNSNCSGANFELRQHERIAPMKAFEALPNGRADEQQVQKRADKRESLTSEISYGLGANTANTTEATANEDDRLMLSVYKSIVLGNESGCSVAFEDPARDMLGRPGETLIELAKVESERVEPAAVGSADEQIAGELIEFYTPSATVVPLHADNCSEGQKLIEFSKGQAKGRQVHEVNQCELMPFASSSALRTNNCQDHDHDDDSVSAFEIKVPALENSSGERQASLDEPDGFIGSCQLVVKHLELPGIDGVGVSGAKQAPAHLTNSTHLIQDQVSAAARPPTSYGHPNGREVSSRMVASNKMLLKRPVSVNYADNKTATSASREQINGQGIKFATKCNGSQLERTMIESTQTTKGNLSECLSSASIGGNDNRKKTEAQCINTAGAAAAAAISKTEANLAGLELAETTTGDVGSGKSNKAPPAGQVQPLVAQPCGASNCFAKDHEAPEIKPALSVGQSSGAAGREPAAEAAGGEFHSEDCSRADPASGGIESANADTAQEQQVAGNKLGAAITKLTIIRDVPPEADPTAQNHLGTAKIVSGTNERLSVASFKQVNENKLEGKPDEPAQYGEGHIEAQYADSSLAKVELQANNVNHDEQVNILTTTGGGNTSGESIVSKTAPDMTGSHFVIESFTKLGSDSNLPLARQQQQSTGRQRDERSPRQMLERRSTSSTIGDEDRGSSCSSSGFGASVSVTSSSDGSNSIGCDPALAPVGVRRDSQADSRRPLSLCNNGGKLQGANEPALNSGSPLYDQVRSCSTNCWPRAKALEEQFPDYKLLVGPDEAYPRKSNRTLLVENHNYATIALKKEEREAILVGEGGINLTVGYANVLPQMLPAKSEPASTTVGYATVRMAPEKGGKEMRLNGESSSSSSDASCLSSHSYSSASAISGGFSALKPPKVADCSPANNDFPSLSSLTGENSHKKSSSLLRRFGSLVSKAFTAGNGASAPSVRINESASANPLAGEKHQGEERQLEGSHAIKAITDCHQNDQLSAKVIEKEDHQVAAEGEHGGADLVILPSKSINNSQKQTRKPLQQQMPQVKAMAAQHHQHDGRLTRAKTHSRRLLKRTAKLSPISNSISTNEAAETSSSCSCCSSTRSNSEGGAQTNGRPRNRSDSISEELESLMSGSEDSSSRKMTDDHFSSLKLSRRRAHSSGKFCTLDETTRAGRFEIDCVLPGKGKAREGKGVASSGGEKPLNGRSLLHLFTSAPRNSPLTADSAPNLSDSRRKNRNRKCCAQDQVDSNQLLQRRPIAGLWGLTSLIDQNHAKQADLVASKGSGSRKASIVRASRATNLESPPEQSRDLSSLIYSNLASVGYKRNLPAPPNHHDPDQSVDEIEGHKLDQLGGYHSLSVYPSLLRNYVKKRSSNSRHHHHHHHQHHHHRHHGGHHHHHHRHSQQRSRHAHNGAALCGQTCHSSGQVSLEDSAGSSGCGKIRASVWGQLIKINKSDGSQVIELKRLTGKPWGFFVARGSINNTKGIFISRMHDDLTSNSLSGLLSIGDRILAIDDCPIEPDYDILRVNQLISKKNKILLRVRPFKG